MTFSVEWQLAVMKAPCLLIGTSVPTFNKPGIFCGSPARAESREEWGLNEGQPQGHTALCQAEGAGRDVEMNSELSSGKQSSGQAGQRHREVWSQAGVGAAAERTGE